MRKVLLPLFALMLGTASAQNVQDQKVAFNYIQWPTNPLESGVASYSLATDATLYEKMNEDSMAAYDAKIAAFDAEFATWLEEKRRIDKAYLMAMADWEKKSNANTTGVAIEEPKRAPYPKQPIKEDIKLPLLTEPLEVSQLGGAISLAGYDKGEGGATVTIRVLGFQNAKFNVKKTGEGAATKYAYSSSCSMPIEVVVETPGQGEVLRHTVNTSPSTANIKTYASKYEFEVWLIDNYEKHWKQRQKDLLNKGLNQINQVINDKCGFPTKSRSTEVYTVKKYKEHDYSDLIDAFTAAKQGYDVIFKDKEKSDAKGKIQNAIGIWESALAESDVNDSKSRVNKKVTALLYANLAEAYMWIDDYATADNYIQKGKIAGVAKYKKFCKNLQGVSNGMKQRYEANH